MGGHAGVRMHAAWGADMGLEKAGTTIITESPALPVCIDRTPGTDQ